MTLTTRVKTLWKLAQLMPSQRDYDWTKENKEALARWLTQTSEGAKVLDILRNGAVGASQRVITAKNAEHAYYLAGAAAGYTAAVAVLDELTGANSISEEEPGEQPDPLDFGIVA